MSKHIFYPLSGFWIAAVVLFGSVEPVYADKPIGTRGPGTAVMDGLVSEVLSNNPELEFYRSEINAARGARITAASPSNPEFSGSLGSKRVWNEEDELTGKGTAGDVTVTQAFEWPGRIGLRKAIADRDIELAELALEQFTATLAARAKTAVYELSAAQQLAAATREVADHFRALREVLVQRDPAGLTPLLEMRVIEAMELTMQRKAGTASIAAQSALLRLNQLRGTAVDAELTPVIIPMTFRPLKEDHRALAALARTNDYSVRIKEIELARQGSRVELAGNEQFPAISVGPSFSQEGSGDRERVIGAALALPLPLWNQNQGGIAAAKAQKTQAETSLDLARRDAERRVMEAATTYETKVREMESWRPDSLEHFKEAAELADRHYRLGAVPVSIYVELQTQYLEATAGLYDTRIEALAAVSQLELLTGAHLSLTGESADEDKK